MWSVYVVLISIYMVRDTLTLLIPKSKSGLENDTKNRMKRIELNLKKKIIRLPSKTGITQNRSEADTLGTV